MCIHGIFGKLNAYLNDRLCKVPNMRFDLEGEAVRVGSKTKIIVFNDTFRTTLELARVRDLAYSYR